MKNNQDIPVPDGIGGGPELREKLDALNSRLAVFLENTSDWLWEVDAAGRFLYSSRQSYEIVGWYADEMPYRYFYDFIAADRRNEIKNGFDECVKNSMPSFSFKTNFLDKTGNSIALSCRMNALFGNDGKVRGYVGLSRDLAGIENIRLELREIQELFSLFMENFPGGVYIKDFDTRMLYINKNFEYYLGIKMSDIIGKTNEEVWGDEFGKEMRVSDRFVMEQGILEEKEERLTLAPTGATHTFLSKKFKIPKLGKPPLLGNIMIDITERKQAEEALRQSELLYNTTINAINDWIHVIDRSLSIVLINDALKRVYGRLGFKTDVIGFHVKEANPFLNEETIEEYNEIFKTGREIFYETVETIGDETFIVEIRKTPIFAGESVALIITTMHDITEKKKAEEEIKTTRRELLEKYSFHDIVGKSSQLRNIFDMMPAMAEHDCNILIEGPSGTGKNLIARVIHNISPRSKKPFISVNCGALPEALLESELFGYVKGAFTGASRDKAGKFAIASGGTILLDEIGELPLNLQVKLLHVIEDKRYEPLGGTAAVQANVRIIAATNQNLQKLVKEGKFRLDLYYRLKIVSIKIPSLKERREDIEFLVDHYITALNIKFNKSIVKLSNDVLKFFISYEFPGNIRELQNIMEYAFIFCKGNEISVEDLPAEYKAKAELEKLVLQTTKEAATVAKENATIATTLLKNATVEPGRVEGSFRGDNGRELIIEALDKCKNNKVAAAKLLGIDRTTLWRKMKKYGLI